ncbi:MAG: gamma-glutamyltransferase [Hyphomicrobiaceae bacterium]|nr:gamma-glutamyltransferase [Hyphomicrobiaceae bacterium]
MRDLEVPGRSPVHAPECMAATSHPLATQTAVQVLNSGGNAMDAAIAACAVQCVVEPSSTGIGGDNFCIYAPEGSDQLIAFNGSGRAPAAATAAWYRSKGISMIERQSPHAVTIPGAIDAWDTLARNHGRKQLGELLQPAIRYARDGYPISSRVSIDLKRESNNILKDKATAKVFMPNGRTPEVGEMHRQPELAATLLKIANHGRDAFYKGEVAADIVEFLQKNGGLQTMKDFSAAKGNYVVPIKTNFRGYDVYQCPPNGQGVIALLLLNIMSESRLCGHNPLSVERIHEEIEAGRFAYRDRNLYLADPMHANVPTDWLLSHDLAKQIYAAIDPNIAMSSLPRFNAPQHPSTVYISVVDKNRNCCSFINTLFSDLGSVLMAPQSGVVLHNRAQGFVIDPHHPNCIARRKRPLHTIIPGMVCKNNRAVMPYGVMGGQYQAFGHMQFLTRLFDYGLDIQEAQDYPRFFPNPYNGTVEIEATIPTDIQRKLKAKGHHLARPLKPIGGSQAIWIDYDQNVLTAGSDPRKDGCAIGC